jgi:hypothetical protein
MGVEGIDNLIVLIALRDNRRREQTSYRPTLPLGRHRCTGDLPSYLASLLHFLTVLGSGPAMPAWSEDDVIAVTIGTAYRNEYHSAPFKRDGQYGIHSLKVQI